MKLKWNTHVMSLFACFRFENDNSNTLTNPFCPVLLPLTVHHGIGTPSCEQTDTHTTENITLVGNYGPLTVSIIQSVGKFNCAE